MTTHPARTPVLRALVLALLGALALLVGTAGAASAQTTTTTNPSGFVRVGHLAPGVGPVDVTLTAPDGTPSPMAQKAPYGRISDYQTLAPGTYTLAMRAAGSAADSTPLLSASVPVASGTAYTVLVAGTPDALVTRVVTDDLTPPSAGSARARVLQGAPDAATLTIRAVGGPVVARNVAYGTATGYGDVPQGRWTLRVTTPDGTDALENAPTVDLAAGTVNSLVVTQDASGRFSVTPIVDATGLDTAAAPQAGVETGGGGTATTVVGSSTPRTVVALTVVGLVGVGVLLGRRRVA